MLSLDTFESSLSLLAQATGFRTKTFFEGFDLLETTPLSHGALLSMRGRRERKSRSHHR